MKTPALLSVFLLSFAAQAYGSPERIPAEPFRKVIAQNQESLTVHYRFDGYDSGDDSIEDFIGLEGKPYQKAVELVRPHYRPEDELYSWQCFLYPEGGNLRLCQRSFHGGNFESVSYFHFTFYFMEDATGIRLVTRVVDATAYRD